MGILDGVKNFLKLVFENWTTIGVCGSMVYLLYRRARNFFAKSDEEKIAIAKSIVSNTMLQYVSEAERDYAEWAKAGNAKRAQVIARVYADFPILELVIDQNELIAWIDNLIKDALSEMRVMIQGETE